MVYYRRIVKLTVIALFIKVCSSKERECPKEIQDKIFDQTVKLKHLFGLPSRFQIRLCRVKAKCEVSDNERVEGGYQKILPDMVNGKVFYTKGNEEVIWIYKKDAKELQGGVPEDIKGPMQRALYNSLQNFYEDFWYAEEKCGLPTTTVPTTTSTTTTTTKEETKGAEGENGDTDGGAEGEKGGKQPTGSDRDSVAKLPGTELPVIWLVPILYPFVVIGVFVYLVYFKPKGRKNDDEPRASESSNAIELTEASKQSAPSQQSAAGKQSFMSGKQSTAGNRSVKSLSSNRDSGSIQGGDRMSMMSAKSKASGRSFY